MKKNKMRLTMWLWHIQVWYGDLRPLPTFFAIKLIALRQWCMKWWWVDAHHPSCYKKYFTLIEIGQNVTTLFITRCDY
jgi:hypothetical protein